MNFSIMFDKDKCRGCTNCMKRCPTQAIRLIEGKAFINTAKCIHCGECIKICPYNAYSPESIEWYNQMHDTPKKIQNCNSYHFFIRAVPQGNRYMQGPKCNFEIRF